jgi:hypothetical protein
MVIPSGNRFPLRASRMWAAASARVRPGGRGMFFVANRIETFKKQFVEIGHRFSATLQSRFPAPAF